MKLTASLVFILACAVTACGVDAPPPTSTATSAICQDFDDSYCDPNTSCDLGSVFNHAGQYVPCVDGIVMYAYSTPDCRWCIPRDVCASHGGYEVCPL